MCSNCRLVKIGFGLGVVTVVAIAINALMTESDPSAEVNCRLKCVDIFNNCLGSAQNISISSISSNICVPVKDLFQNCNVHFGNCTNACIAIAQRIF